jgi:hypothetical protein
MQIQIATVLVFKTDKNVSNYTEQVKEALEEFHNKISWNLDLDDRDKILRVESVLITPDQIIEKMRAADFYCEELED